MPEVLHCDEFVNADDIAKGLSPFNPESVAIEAGRIMLNRIKHLLNENKTFAFETTLATRSYVGLIKEAREEGYSIVLVYVWLQSADLAKQRVEKRVKEGGHNIPTAVIERRYVIGKENFINLYKDILDDWFLIDNSGATMQKFASSKERLDNEKYKEFIGA